MTVNGSLYPSISYVVDPEVLTEFVYQIVIISAFREIMSSLVIGCQQTEKLQVTPPSPHRILHFNEQLNKQTLIMKFTLRQKTNHLFPLPLQLDKWTASVECTICVRVERAELQSWRLRSAADMYSNLEESQNHGVYIYIYTHIVFLFFMEKHCFV